MTKIDTKKLESLKQFITFYDKPQFAVDYLYEIYKDDLITIKNKLLEWFELDMSIYEIINILEQEKSRNIDIGGHQYTLSFKDVF